jgi:hypothetical protein
MASAECYFCRAEIVSAVKHPEELNDKQQPKTTMIEPSSIGGPDGDLEVWEEQVWGPAGVMRYRYLRKGEVPALGHSLARSHFASCRRRS